MKTMNTAGQADPVLRAAVIGTGWGCLTHVPALRAAGIEVRALAGTDPDRTRARAEALGIPSATTELEAIVNDEETDLVVVATPPSTHAAIVVEAAEAGKHVLCEKPFAHSLQDAIRMRDAAQASGVVGAVGHEFRWLPSSVAAVAAVRSGAVGIPRLFNHLRLSSALSSSGSSAPDWFQTTDTFGGWLNAEIQHLIDEVRMLLGDLATVTALEGQATDHGWDAGDSFVVQFTTVDGAMGSIVSSTGSVGQGLSVQRLSGTRGSLWTNADGTVSVDDGTGPELVTTPASQAVQASGPVETHPDNQQLVDLVSTNTLSSVLSGATNRLLRPTQLMYEAFRNSILGVDLPDQVPTLATFDDGVMNTAVHMAVRRSLETGASQHVEIPFTV
jgi:predicted dehydrogenase